MGWSEQARAAVEDARNEGERMGLDGKALLAHIDAAYPFYGRSNWPYKAWLKARRQQCSDLPGVKPLPKPGEPGRVEPMPDQLSLLERSDPS